MQWIYTTKPPPTTTTNILILNLGIHLRVHHGPFPLEARILPIQCKIYLRPQTTTKQQMSSLMHNNTLYVNVLCTEAIP